MVALAQSLVSGQLAPSLLANTPTEGKYRVGVFTIANSLGKYDAFDMGMLGSLMQGEIYDGLRKETVQKASGKFSFLTPFPGLQTAFETVNLEPDGIYAGGIAGARTVLKQVRIDVGVIGRFSFKDHSELQQLAKTGGSVTLTMTMIYPGTHKDFTASVLASDLILDTPGGSKVADNLVAPEAKQFAVKFFWKKHPEKDDNDPAAWEELAQKTVTNKDSKLYGNRLLIVPRALQGKRYKIQLQNNPTAPLARTPLEKLNADRMFAAAVLIDGVNSFYQKTGEVNPLTKEEVRGPVIRHPSKVSKWVLTAPGRRLTSTPKMFADFPDQLFFSEIVPDDYGPDRGLAKTQRIENGKLVNAEGKGGSVVDVLGFQKDSKTASVFEFGEAAESLAETVGITASVGMIEVHFYREALPIGGGFGGVGGIGTRPGPEIQRGTFLVNFRIHPEPVAVWRVHYRYEDQQISGIE